MRMCHCFDWIAHPPDMRLLGEFIRDGLSGAQTTLRYVDGTYSMNKRVQAFLKRHCYTTMDFDTTISQLLANVQTYERRCGFVLPSTILRMRFHSFNDYAVPNKWLSYFIISISDLLGNLYKNYEGRALAWFYEHIEFKQFFRNLPPLNEMLKTQFTDFKSSKYHTHPHAALERM